MATDDAGISSLIELIDEQPDCELLPPAGIPVVRDGNVLPDDVVAFYRKAGGAHLFKSNEYCLWIVSPKEFRPVNDVMLAGYPAEAMVELEGSRSWDWYVIGTDGSGNYFGVDCGQGREGRCLDCGLGDYPAVGTVPIIASSLSDFLRRLLSADGGYWYWLEPEFPKLGDAYD